MFEHKLTTQRSPAGHAASGIKAEQLQLWLIMDDAISGHPVSALVTNESCKPCVLLQTTVRWGKQINHSELETDLLRLNGWLKS